MPSLYDFFRGPDVSAPADPRTMAGTTWRAPVDTTAQATSILGYPAIKMVDADSASEDGQSKSSHDSLPEVKHCSRTLKTLDNRRPLDLEDRGARAIAILFAKLELAYPTMTYESPGSSAIKHNENRPFRGLPAPIVYGSGDEAKEEQPTLGPEDATFEPTSSPACEDGELLTITTLPTEIVEKIAGYLPLRAVKQFRRTCKMLESQTIHYFAKKYCSRKHVVICVQQLRALTEQAQHPNFGPRIQELVFETWAIAHKEPLQMNHLIYDLRDPLISKASAYMLGAMNNFPNLRKVSMSSKVKKSGSRDTCHAIMLLLVLQHRNNPFKLEALELPTKTNFLCWDLFASVNNGYLRGFHEGPAAFSKLTFLHLTLNGRHNDIVGVFDADNAAASLRCFLKDLRALESLSIHLGEIRGIKETQNLVRTGNIIFRMKWRNLRRVRFRSMSIDASFIRFFLNHNLRELELDSVVFQHGYFKQLAGLLCSDGMPVERIRFNNLHECGVPGPIVVSAAQIQLKEGPQRYTSKVLVAEKEEIGHVMLQYLCSES